ncbi:MAG: NTP transferase domain-containing protein [Deltaproteobacteria bacterium]|nr:NTP transferase domain-containing protein [Deltaproteobacteria bacterium]
MEAIVLAGGLGKRLRAAVPDLPKPMAPIDGRPFLEYQLDYWIGQGIKRFILSIGYKSEVIKDHFKNNYKQVPVAYAEEPTPLGTGGGLLLAIGQLKSQSPFLVLNGDTFFEVDLEQLLQFHRRTRAQCSLAMTRVKNNDRYGGILASEDGKILNLADNKAPIINGGVYIFEPVLFEGLSPGVFSLEKDLLPQFLEAQKPLYGFLSGGGFIDIGVPEDYCRATVFFAKTKHG